MYVLACTVFIGLVIAMVSCAESQESILSVSVRRREYAACSTDGFNGRGTACHKFVKLIGAMARLCRFGSIYREISLLTKFFPA